MIESIGHQKSLTKLLLLKSTSSPTQQHIQLGITIQDDRKNMRILSITAALSASLIATPAFAQNEDSKTGAWMGIVGGVDSVSIAVSGESGSEEGFVYGLAAGYDVDLGSAVVGIEAEYSDSSVSESMTDLLTAGDRAELNATRDLYLGARIGFQASPAIIVFAKGGYTNAGVELEYDDGIDSLSDSDELGGFRVGGGVEFQLSDMTFIRTEYRYSDYGEYSFQGLATGISASRHQGTASLFFRF
jgi:outer membrane immunogenic protein